MIRVLIVDDEPEIGRILKKMIERQEGFSVAGVCTGFAEALRVFSELRPQVVFMDIDLGGESGLACAKIMTELEPRVSIVFATAHSEYMAGAFELYAFDYLVKPFNMERIARTLSRIRELSGAGEEKENARAELENPTGGSERLLIRGKEQVFFVEKAAILLIERRGGATVITTRDGSYQTGTSLSALEEVLDSRVFFRCHKSFIINLRALVSAEVYGRWTYCVHLRDTDRTALMTAQKYEELKTLL